MDQTEQFVDFLTKHNALDKFIKNLGKPQGYLPSKFCIDTAFIWERTSEGFYYWLTLSNEWALLAKDNRWEILYNLYWKRENILSGISFRQNPEILEIGCACGGTLLRIKNNNPSAELDGIEICEPAAEIAKNFAEVLTADLELLERTDFIGKFDYIIMGDVLEHLFNTDAVLHNVHSWLNQHGKLVVSVPNISHISILLSLLSGQWEYMDSGILDRTHVRFFTVNSIKHCLQKNGFHVDFLGGNVADLDNQNASMFEALQEELLQLKTVCVNKEYLKTFQIFCLASKRV